MKCIFLTVFILILMGCSQNPKTTSVQGWVRSISPDSRKIVVFRGIGKNIVDVCDTQTLSPIWTKYVGNFLYHFETFVSNTEILTVTDSIRFQITNISTGQERYITKLNEIKPSHLHMDYPNGQLYISEGGNQAQISTIYIYNFNNQQLEKFSFKESLEWTFSIAPRSKLFLYANISGFLGKIDLDAEVITFLKDIKGNRIEIGESPINLLKNGNELLFSFPDMRIAVYQIDTGTIMILPNFDGFLFPLLAPSEEFIFADNGQVRPFYSTKFNFQPKINK